MADADRPALSEEDYFWQGIMAEALHNLCDRAIALCCPAAQDSTMFRGVFLQQHQQHVIVLQHHPADMHALGSPAMVARGAAARQCFYRFTDILTSEAKNYVSNPTPAAVHAMGTTRSNRRPPQQDTYSLQLQQLQTVQTLNAQEYEERSADDYYDADDADFAAVGGSTATAPLPSDDTADGRRRARGDTPYGKRRDSTPTGGLRRASLNDTRRSDNVGSNRSRFQDRATQPRSRLSQSISEASTDTASHGSRKREAPNDAPGATDDGRRSSTTSRSRRRAQLPAEAPRSGESSEIDISEYIARHRVCFSHARGEVCQRMTTRGRCPYSHAEEPIPFNSYPREPRVTAMVDDENTIFYESTSTVRALHLAALVEDVPPQDVPTTGQPPGNSPQEHHRREPVTAAALGGSASAPTTALSGSSKGSHQSYVKAYVWNRRKRRSGFLATVLVDTGAGGGNYASVKFIHAVQRHVFGGKNIVSKRGRGFLHAANPAKNAVPPMSITGTALLPLIFPPVDRVFTARVRVVQDLPFGLILGAAFLRHYDSVLDFKGPGSFKPSGDSDSVALLPAKRPQKPIPWRDHHPAHALSNALLASASSKLGWTAAPHAVRSGRVRNQKTGDFEDASETIAADTYSAQVIPGRVSAEVGALTLGPRPFTSQLVVVIPLPPFDSEKDVAVGAAKGVQWWTPGAPLKAKLTNHTKHTKSIDAGVQIATAYATNCDDVERMLLLKEPAPPAITPEPPPQPPPTVEASPEPSDTIKVDEINTGPLSPRARTTLLKIIRAQADKGLFPVKGAPLKQIHGREVSIPLKDPNATPIACKQQRLPPQSQDILNSTVDKLHEQGIVEYADSQWCSRVSLQPKKDGGTRMTLDYRPLNNLTVKNSGGIGNLASMHDRVRKSKWFTLLDLPQAYHQIPIKPSDRPKTAFRDARGRLYQFTRCSFGLTTIPAVFSALLGDTLRPTESKGGIERWLDDILIHSETLEEHLKKIDEVLKLLQEAGFSVHFDKSLFCMQEVEFLGVMVGRSGVRPPPSKIKAITEMEKPTTVGGLRSFVGMANFLRDFVKDFSAIVAPLTDILRNKDFSTKRARNLAIPWGEEQDAAHDAIIRALVSPPVLLPPDWELPFTLHTDASERAAGAVLTQVVEDHDTAIGFGSHRWTQSEAKRAPTDREVRAALFGLEHFRIYLLHQPFTLVTDCSAITWLFQSQHLSSTMYRYALRMMEFTMTLQWRKGTEHTIPDALSRLPQKGPPGPPVDTTFPDDNSRPSDGTRDPLGPVLDGVPLQSLVRDDDDRAPPPKPADVGSGELAGSTPSLDGIKLATLGATEVASGPALSLPVLWALQHRLETPEPGDHARLAAYAETREAFTPKRPRAAVLGCGAGGSLLALGEMLDVQTAIDPDWTAIECARANDWSYNVNLVRTSLASSKCKEAIAHAKPEILIDNACRRYDPDRTGSTANRHATDITDVFLSSRATLLVLECPARFVGTTEWRETLRPRLERSRCSVEEATISAACVGVPTGQQRTFVVACKRQAGDTNLGSQQS
ncbi:unnamed protein product [Ectocarpus sp. CCAP 1310/34]|nr:unnamed protein product [Ectocarpus sp. CCAP 1310/34]